MHQVVPLDDLAAAGEAIVARLLENGPVAIAETKALGCESAWAPSTARRSTHWSDACQKRRSADATEGLASFAESWRQLEG